ncbi:MAG: glycogen-binding domain-containing protein [Candidatus Omnitrophota bacterium]|nr:glycogen-binding domain-containing protein [Candidatus Omnitrophota bacterium]
MVRLCAAKPTEFKLFAPQAKRVSLAGSFNNWDAKKLSARKDSKGNWIAKTNLKPGNYEYKFVVDGSWTNDPGCNRCVPNGVGSCNCVIEVK